MGRPFKIVVGVFLALILAAGAFFAGSSYYSSKQKNAQLASMKD